MSLKNPRTLKKILRNSAASILLSYNLLKTPILARALKSYEIG